MSFRQYHFARGVARKGYEWRVLLFAALMQAPREVFGVEDLKEAVDELRARRAAGPAGWIEGDDVKDKPLANTEMEFPPTPPRRGGRRGTYPSEKR